MSASHVLSLGQPLLSANEEINQNKEAQAPLTIGVYDPVKFARMIDTCLASLKENGINHVSTKMLAGQIFLAFMGVFAGFLYFDPAKSCAEGDCDDQWLTRLIPQQIVRQYLYFLSGFIGYGATNCTFSYYGPPKFIELLKQMNSNLTRVLATGGVITFVLVQGLQILLMGKGTDIGAMDLTMSIIGAAPGAVYGSAGIVSHIPSLWQRSKSKIKQLYYNLKLSSLDKDKLNELAKTKFYATQREKFNQRLEDCWKNIVLQAKHIEVEEDENPISFLLSYKNPNMPRPNWQSKIYAGIKLATTSFLSCVFCIPFVSNTDEILGSSIDKFNGTLVASGLISSTTIYGNIALTYKAVNTTFDTAKSILQNEKINSLVFQLRPVQTSAIIASSVATAAFSYSIIDCIWQAMWPSATEHEWQNDVQSAGRGIARASIDLYHATGMADVGTQLLFKRILNSGTPKEKYLAKLQLIVEYLTITMPQEEFIEHIEKTFTPEECAELELQSWENFQEKIATLSEIDRYNLLLEQGLKRYYQIDAATNPFNNQPALGLFKSVSNPLNNGEDIESKGQQMKPANN